MMEKYLLLNDEIFIFHPDTHEVFRVDPKRIERFEHPQAMMTLRLRAVEITRNKPNVLSPHLNLCLAVPGNPQIIHQSCYIAKDQGTGNIGAQIRLPARYCSVWADGF